MKPSVYSRKYDLVVSLGQWCATSIILKKLGLRSTSGPFDWAGRFVTFGGYVDLMTTGFGGFVLKENMRHVGSNPGEGVDYYLDTGTDLEFRHDFRIGVPFDDEYDRFRAMMHRREDRLLRALHSACNVIFVQFYSEGRYAREGLVSDLHRLRACFPEAHIDVMILEISAADGHPVWEEPAPGCCVVTGRFFDPRSMGVLGDERLCREVLRGIRLRGRFLNWLRVRMESFRRRWRRWRQR